MSIKVKGKDWSCSNQCQHNCCSEVFIDLSKEQKQIFDKHKTIILDNNATDFRWLGFHKGITINKISSTERELIFDDNIITKTIYFQKGLQHILHIDSVCSKLLPDNRCKIYRIRPKVCRVGKCSVFNKTIPILRFLALSGKLKTQRFNFEDGKLKKHI